MSWAPQHSGGHTQWSLSHSQAMPPFTNAEFSQYPDAVGAATQPQLSQGTAPSAPPAGRVPAPVAAVARQKARYARAYVPPPALQRSRLPPSPLLAPAPGSASAQDAVHRGNDGRHAFTQPPSLSQSVPQFASGVHGRELRGPVTQAAFPATRAGHVAATTAAPPPAEWCQAMLALQERQLQCWQQLVDTQQLLAHHVHRLHDEVRQVREVLAEKRGHRSPSASQKRTRGEGAEVVAAASGPHAAATAVAPPALPTASTAVPHPRLLPVHGIRLLGESRTSTPAVPADGLSPPPDTHKPCERKGGEGEDVGGRGEAESAAAAAYAPSSGDAADSEADIFLL